jgi:thiamine phosphate synthase YjbQ (UPF0047 family)
MMMMKPVCVRILKDGLKASHNIPTNKYQHNRTGEDNADAHLKRQIMGREVVIAITKENWTLGPGNKYSMANLTVARAKGF